MSDATIKLLAKAALYVRNWLQAPRDESTGVTMAGLVALTVLTGLMLLVWELVVSPAVRR